MSTQGVEAVSYGRRLTLLAATRPERPVIIFAPQHGPEHDLTWHELDARSNQAARLLARRGVDERSLVVVGLPNCPEHYVATFAAWKLGALVLPLRAALPGRERDQILELGNPAVVVADWEGVAFPLVTTVNLAASADLPTDPLPDRTPHPGKAIASGGSTGRPKIIVDPRPLRHRSGEPPVGIRFDAGLRPDQVQLIAGPLYHNSPFGWGHAGVQEGHTLVLMDRFDAARAVELIARHRVNFAFLAPTMMRRIVQLPDIARRDLASLDAIIHTAAPCPPWLKRAWIDLIGGEKVREGFGSSEAVGMTGIRGDEWLAHPGSVGRPYGCDLRILDDTGQALPTGEVGEIFMRPHGTAPTYAYLGSPPAKTTSEGFTSVGDLGWVDGEGYLFLADRRVDLIITGGANVYPAEVEAALTEHPGVGDVAVIGVLDDDWGKRVHAVIQPRDPANPPTVGVLDAHCRERLASYKIPKSYEFSVQLPRDDAGKLRRSGLVAERAAGWTTTMIAAPRRIPNLEP